MFFFFFHSVCLCANVCLCLVPTKNGRQEKIRHQNQKRGEKKKWYSSNNVESEAKDGAFVFVRACNSRNMHDDDWINGFYLLYKLARHAIIAVGWLCVHVPYDFHFGHRVRVCVCALTLYVSYRWHIASALMALSCMFDHNSIELNVAAKSRSPHNNKKRTKRCQTMHASAVNVRGNWINCVHQSYPFGNIVTGNLF